MMEFTGGGQELTAAFVQVGTSATSKGEHGYTSIPTSATELEVQLEFTYQSNAAFNVLAQWTAWNPDSLVVKNSVGQMTSDSTFTLTFEYDTIAVRNVFWQAQGLVNTVIENE